MHILTTPRPQRHEGSDYCATNKCYTPTEFGLFGVGAIIMGTMVGVVGISWFKSQCLPDEKSELEQDIRRPKVLLNHSDHEVASKLKPPASHPGDRQGDAALNGRAPDWPTLDRGFKQSHETNF